VQDGIAGPAHAAVASLTHNRIPRRTTKPLKVTFETGPPLSARDVADDVAHGEEAIESNRRAMVVCVGSETGSGLGQKRGFSRHVKNNLTHKTRLLCSQILALKHSIQYLEGLMDKDGD
jgi:hypothetical protein